MMNHIPSQKGYVILMSVLISGAIGLSVAVSVILLGLGSSRSSSVLEQSHKAKSFSNACAEKALNTLRQNTGYTGSETINFSGGNCQILPILGSGNSSLTVQAIGTHGTVVRKVEVQISVVRPQMTLSSWKEVSDF